MLKLFLMVLIPFVVSAQHEINIVVLGSSTAAGYGPQDKEDSWVNLYREYLNENSPINVNLINLAKKGYSTFNVMPSEVVPPAHRPFPDTARNITKALSYEPSAIIINLPSNDAGKGYTVKEQVRNYNVILEYASIREIPTWITTTQPRNFKHYYRENLEAMREVIMDKFELRSIDFWSGLSLSNGFIRPEFDSGDGIHLNRTAHELLFHRVVESEILESMLKHAIEVRGLDLNTSEEIRLQGHLN